MAQPGGLQFGAVNTLLNAVTANGASGAFTVPSSPNAQRGGFIQTMTMQVNTTGSPTGWSVQLQGSLDGVNWSNLGSAVAHGGSSPAVAINLSTSGAGPYAFVQAVLSSLAGGTSPTVTALLALGAV